MLAFVHIEKSAGTSLIHILRRNYFFKYLDVRPLNTKSKGLFTLDDLNYFKKINSRLMCISGHAVVPYGDFMNVESLKLITLLRDPVKRYVSQYQHWLEKKYVDIPFEDFLNIETVANFQTKKIAGSDNVELAISKLEKFFLVGTLECFDEFLILLANKLKPMNFDPSYKRINLANKTSMSEKIISKYLPQIEEKNNSDIILYKHAVEKIRERNRQLYGSTLEVDVEKFKKSNAVSLKGKLKLNVDYLYRKFYITPVTNKIRKKNGLQQIGSY